VHDAFRSSPRDSLSAQRHHVAPRGGAGSPSHVRTAAVALAAFVGLPALDAQQSKPQQPQQGSASGRDDRTEDYILVRLAEREWIGADFAVNVKDGTATLSGSVPSETAKARMGRIARQTIGVRDVQNDLQVRPLSASVGSGVNDAELAERVARRVASEIPGAKSGEDWWLEGWRVEGPDNIWNFVVEAENGRVYLEGDVPRLSIMRKAVDAARQTQGVQSVRSDLEIDRFHGDTRTALGAPTARSTTRLGIRIRTRTTRTDTIPTTSSTTST
jgi:osmotically-inducible protein OsmY